MTRVVSKIVVTLVKMIRVGSKLSATLGI